MRGTASPAGKSWPKTFAKAAELVRRSDAVE